MPLIHGNSREIIGANIKDMMASGHPQNQAVAAALRTADAAHALGGKLGIASPVARAAGGIAGPVPHPLMPSGIAGPFWLSHQGSGSFQIHERNPAQRRDSGGGVSDPNSPGIGGVAPSSATMNPITQGAIQRYASLPTEKLQEYATMLGSSPQGQIVQRLLAQRRAMPNATQQQPSQTQQPASTTQQAPQVQQTQQQHRGGEVRRDMGGGMSLSTDVPWWTKQQAEQDARPSGFLSGSTMGRSDAVHTQAPGGSYILPASLVSGLGEGNSDAGAKVWDEILRSAPHGIEQAPERRGRGPPQPPRLPSSSGYEAKGGGVQGADASGAPVPVALSHGEIFVPPEDVKRFGGGNLKKGQRVLDRWVQMELKRIGKEILTLPGPVGAKKAK